MASHRKAEAQQSKVLEESQARHWIAEWAVTILIFLFGTTTVLQAFVVPTGSMEGTMLIGDHLFVDRLSYAPPGTLGAHLLPYQDVKRGDIIVFRYPLDIRQNYVKRVIGVPGDRIRIVNKTVHLNGSPGERAIQNSDSAAVLRLPEQLSAIPRYRHWSAGYRDAARSRKRRRIGGPGRAVLRDGRQSR